MGVTSRITIANIDKAAEHIDPVFLNSPQYLCESLGALLECRLMLKVEIQNPIRSFKGRGADWLIHQLQSNTPIICASAGNFGQAMAYACRKKKISLTVYAGTTANALKLERMRSLGARVILEGEDFDAAKEAARAAAASSGTRFVEDSLDIETVEGAGTIGLELLDFPHELDYLLIALGNGALFNGIASVFKVRSPTTRLIAVQAAGAPAMIESWKSGQTINYEKMDTIADGIAVRIPVQQALDDMQGLADEGILVQEESILKGMKLLQKHANLVCEPSAAVGVAAIMENPYLFKNKTLGTIICGGNLTEQQMKEWL